MLTITIATDNAAFNEGHGSKAIETARILRALAETIETQNDLNHRLRDINGNTVGESVES